MVINKLTRYILADNKIDKTVKKLLKSYKIGQDR